MTFRNLLPPALIVVLLVATGFVAVQWLVPARRDAAAAVATAARRAAEIEGQPVALVGSAYEDSAKAARQRAADEVRGAEATLRRQSQQLGRWFARLETDFDAEPQRDRFRDAFAFHADELTREISKLLRETSGVDPKEVPQWQPAFVREQRLPKDAAEMRDDQLHFNLQRLVLIAAARAGGIPVQAVEFAEGFPPDDEDRLYRVIQCRLRAQVEPARVAGLLRELVDLDGEGPVVRPISLQQRPLPGEAKLGRDDAYRVLVDVRIAASIYVGGKMRGKAG